jgi:hypothetical protein
MQTDVSVLLVLGSYDGRKWQPIGIKQRYVNESMIFGEGYNDIGCVTDRVS